MKDRIVIPLETLKSWLYRMETDWQCIECERGICRSVHSPNVLDPDEDAEILELRAIIASMEKE